MKNSIFGFTYYTIFCSFLFLSIGLNAQNTPTAVKPDNLVIQSLTQKVESHGWLYLKEDALVKENDLFTTYKSDMGLGPDDQMIVEKTWDDDLGYTHVRYQQHYKGIPVEYAEYTEHLKDCQVKIAHGKLVEQLAINTSPTIAEATALQNALTHLGATEYAWQNTEWEEDLQEDEGDSTATYFPNGELRLTNINNGDLLPANYALAWRFEIIAITPTLHTAVYVDAHSGAIIKTDNQELHATGTASTLYNGNVTFHTAWFGGLVQKYILRDQSGNHNIHTKDHAFGKGWGRAKNVKDADNNWESGQAKFSSPHWAAHVIWDYFETQQNWKGPTNQGEVVRIYADYVANATPIDPNPGNILYKNENGKHYLYIGQETHANGGTLIDGGALDVVAHEWTHGLTSTHAEMGRHNQPGALQESFCDIFGEIAENHHDGNPDWVQGNQFQFRRSLQNPRTFSHACGNSFGDPDTYLGSGWVTDPNCDRGGVHSNAGPQNKWFYLLSEGGFQNSQSVFGLGIDKAADITFYNLAHFMQEASQYPDARSGAVAAAWILYGKCSGETKQTTNAWAAVGVGVSFVSCEFEINGPTFICMGGPGPGGATYTASGTAGTSYTWSISAGWSYYTSGPGNNTLVATNIPIPPPPYPISVTITVTSSNSITKTLQVVLDDCGHGAGFCGEVSSPSAKKAKPGIRKNDQISIYPNPAYDRLIIDHSNNIDSWEIIDVSGKRVKQEQVSGTEQITLSLHTLKNGLYFIRIHTNDGFQTLKFIKTE